MAEPPGTGVWHLEVPQSPGFNPAGGERREECLFRVEPSKGLARQLFFCGPGEGLGLPSLGNEGF